MTSVLRTILIGGLAVAGSALAAETANAQWGYYGPSYGGTSFSFGFSTGPRYSTYYAPAAYPTYYAPAYGYSYSSGPAYYGGIYTRPRGRVAYDVYTPFGRSEVNYRINRYGRVRVDIDD